MREEESDKGVDNRAILLHIKKARTHIQRAAALILSSDGVWSDLDRVLADLSRNHLHANRMDLRDLKDLLDILRRPSSRQNSGRDKNQARIKQCLRLIQVFESQVKGGVYDRKQQRRK